MFADNGWHVQLLRARIGLLRFAVGVTESDVAGLSKK